MFSSIYILLIEMQNAKCKMQNIGIRRSGFVFRNRAKSFCVLHSEFCIYRKVQESQPQTAAGDTLLKV